MDWQRNLLIGAIVAVLALLFIRWNAYEAEHLSQGAVVASEELLVPDRVPVTTANVEPGGDLGAIPSANTGEAAVEVQAEGGANGRLVTVTSDYLELVIDTYGGDIVKASLLQYPQSQETDAKPIVILNRTSDQLYIAQSGLIGSDGTDTNSGRPQFTSAAQSYRLGDGQEVIEVNLSHRQGEVTITKQYVLRRGDYLVDVNYLIDNRSTSPWRAGLFGQIQRDDHQPPSPDGFGMQPYLGAAVNTVDTNYKKVTFGDLQDEEFTTTKAGGWVAMVQHYFISAWVPDQQAENAYTLKKLGDKNLYTLGFVSPAVEVLPGEKGAIKASFYVGPKDQYRLEEISPYLDLTVDYGWLWWIAKPIFYLLTLIHSFVGNWGWSIILLTVVIKGLFYRLSATSYRSMAKMRKLQPEMARLKDLYGDDRQKMSQEMMNFYKKEKVNPMGGCLPILIQMPVFIALYWVLFESVELRQAPWILWITDLSVKDPYFVLPVLNGICMYITTLLQPEPPDPTQAKIMKIMPVAFSFMFAFFPAGLVLYWTVNSLLSILQQWYITRQIDAKA